MTAYETVFRAYASELEPDDLYKMSRVFYTSQVRIILGWTDLTDSEQITYIRSLDNAFYEIVERTISNM
ncbi:hypothetical protein M5X17_30065 [Paenibacillus alvei]|uniref:hypothetical protein n=1 Tax=Paenibacillus alvei TaxID=44250 RepID=UPI0018CF0765|nr:hypothetical protein [Paenibacillus alvei]MBG9737075.1 hypothetical protein [Paenibacillus alvei]MBG9742815.1 hypothetical protein [Paenibacillus alvei]MBG9746168.1 hypothetical protein [Paenibacillus alvei]MCY9579723.1 hypothetical protein [Paenibacillus alvei]MCY9586376.1 hypothetical protein [Paenibacillus alvei]